MPWLPLGNSIVFNYLYCEKFSNPHSQKDPPSKGFFLNQKSETTPREPDLSYRTHFISLSG